METNATSSDHLMSFHERRKFVKPVENPAFKLVNQEWLLVVFLLVVFSNASAILSEENEDFFPIATIFLLLCLSIALVHPFKEFVLLKKTVRHRLEGRRGTAMEQTQRRQFEVMMGIS